MRRINQCFNKQLLNICKRSMVLDELNHKVLNLLPENMRTHCSVGSFDKGCLLLVITEHAFASELRFYLPTLRDELRTAGLYQLLSIKSQVAANMPPKIITQRLTKKMRPLSESSRKALDEAAKTCSYQPLKDLLERMSQKDTAV